MRCFALAVCVAALIPLLRAELPTGTWVRRPNKDGLDATMIVETAGRGRKLTFKLTLHGGGHKHDDCDDSGGWPSSCQLMAIRPLKRWQSDWWMTGT
jgi:hypothetical protein